MVEVDSVLGQGQLQLVLVDVAALFEVAVVAAVVSVEAVDASGDAAVATEVVADSVVLVLFVLLADVGSELVLQPTAKNRPAAATKVLRNIFSPFICFLVEFLNTLI